MGCRPCFTKKIRRKYCWVCWCEEINWRQVKQSTNSISGIIVAWCLGKLNSLTFNGENGESLKKALTCLCKTIVDDPVDAAAPKDLACICQRLNVANEVVNSPIVITPPAVGEAEF